MNASPINSSSHESNIWGSPCLNCSLASAVTLIALTCIALGAIAYWDIGLKAGEL